MRSVRIALILVALHAEALAQAPLASESARAIEAAKIAVKAAEEYKFSREGKSSVPLTFEPKPLLQWSNPVVGSIHGTVFVWTDKGRPEVVASIYKWYGPKNFHLGVEFHSLSTDPIRAERLGQVAWSPRKPGLAFAPVPNAPAVADSAAKRLSQMRTIAEQFNAVEKDHDGVTRELRRLTQPVYRNPGSDPTPLDGALFTFVLGTDPEVFLLLEARRRADGTLGWDYALTRMNSVQIRVTHQGREVWSLPVMPWDVVFGHVEPYTVFMFN